MEINNLHFWLFFELIEAWKFKSYQRGSVIPYVKLRDLREVLKQYATHVYQHYQEYRQIVEDLSKLDQRKPSLAEQIVSTKHLQQHLINDAIVKKPKSS